jgi:hypothetical protein
MHDHHPVSQRTVPVPAGQPAGREAYGASDTQRLLEAVHDDTSIDLGTKLLIELAEYDRGVLP